MAAWREAFVGVTADRHVLKLSVRYGSRKLPQK